LTEFEPVIGLEVHAELQTATKMFCGCEVVDSTSADPNTYVCEICTGMPGTLPVINKRAVEFAIRVALALHCEIAEVSVFARKNYFYPDLPKGFQISQYELPLARNGWMIIDDEEDHAKKIRIRRVHLEEDTGKLFHQTDHSSIDYNRSGVPLLEIVSEPDLRSIDEVRSYASQLRSIMRYLDVSSGDMEKGVIRFEANISLRPLGSDQMGTRTEIKNLNSFRGMERALQYEIQRQSDLLRKGESVSQETVGWDETKGVTVTQRGKEEAHDYRYFPEPDLPPLVVERSWIEEIRSDLPELAQDKQARYVREFEITPYSARVLTSDKTVANYFERTASAAPELPGAKIANWITGELFGLMNEHNLSIEDIPIPPEGLVELIQLVEDGTINLSSGKAVLAEMLLTGEPATKIVEAQGLAKITDSAEIEDQVRTVISENPEQLQLYQDGKHSVLEWFFGQAMRAMNGRADPKTLRTSLEKHLNELEKHHGGG
jgi:aspartyl-tRNA(Asn)/glutamyl-tRNA(Gln) amidotransferase subunit B